MTSGRVQHVYWPVVDEDDEEDDDEEEVGGEGL